MVATIAHTFEDDSLQAGIELGRSVLSSSDGERPDAVLLFTVTKYDYSLFLEAFAATARPRLLVGASTIGAFAAGANVERGACAIAFRSGEVRFSVGLGEGLRDRGKEAAKSLLSGFRGLTSNITGAGYRTAIVLIDARSGHADELVQDLILGTHGSYQFLGGGAADDMLVESSHVFLGTRAYEDSAVALEILSGRPIGVSVVHAWRPSSPPLRVTCARERRLVSLNAIPAAEYVEEHARNTGQHFDPADPLKFFLKNLFGLDLGGGFKLRIPLVVESDGSITCAAEIPEGTLIRMMTTDAALGEEAVRRAAQSARIQLGDAKPGLGLSFDCVGARLRKQLGFGYDLRGVEDVLGTVSCVSVGTAGQIVRADGEFGGFQNSTSVLLLMPS